MTLQQTQYSGKTGLQSVASGDEVIQVLVAEDSKTIRYYLVGIINETPGMKVIGEARDGEEAVSLTAELKPDIVSMDVRMPRMDGLEATRQIMAECPTPVVIVSGLVQTDIEMSFEAIEAGALAVVEKPPDRAAPNFLEKRQLLTRTLAAMSQVRVIRRATKPIQRRDRKLTFEIPDVNAAPELIAIGASAGGPSALSTLLAQLPGDLSVPVVISQHIPNEFVSGMALWLDKVTNLKVQVVSDGDILKPGVVNLSPGTAHLKVCREHRELVARLDSEKGPHRYQPSVDVLFESVAEVCGERAVGLILTGMGDDGAVGLLKMKQAGAPTLAQNEATSTVFGMPHAAIERGAVDQVLSLSALPLALLRLVPGTG